MRPASSRVRAWRSPPTRRTWWRPPAGSAGWSHSCRWGVPGGRARQGPFQREAWRAFGPLGAACVAVLAVTGVYGMAGEVASLDAALRTTYGRALLGKSGLFLAMGLVGLCSSAVLHHAVARSTRAVLRRPVAWLSAGAAGPSPSSPWRPGSASPSWRWRPSLQPRRQRSALASRRPLTPCPRRAAPPRGTSLSACRPTPTGRERTCCGCAPPAHAGRCRTTSTWCWPGSSPAAGTGASAVETVQLAAVGDGTYEASTSVLGQAGTWQAEVVVRRAGVEDVTAGFDWELPLANRRPRLVSDRPWGGPLRGAAAVLVVRVGGNDRRHRRAVRGHPRRRGVGRSGAPVPLGPVTGGARS